VRVFLKLSPVSLGSRGWRVTAPARDGCLAVVGDRKRDELPSERPSELRTGKTDGARSWSVFRNAVQNLVRTKSRRKGILNKKLKNIFISFKNPARRPGVTDSAAPSQNARRLLGLTRGCRCFYWAQSRAGACWGAPV
jgi:hypothetical protein